MDFQIILAGLNHRTASVASREQFSLAPFCCRERWPVPRLNGIRESLILATCNRVEILGIGAPDSQEEIMRLWARACGAPLEELKSLAYVHLDLAAVRHVFEVASSLDSMILGEPQILGQLKEAYKKSVALGQAGPIVNQLLHRAFSVGKRVRSETAVAASAVSVSYAAVELAKRIFGALPGHRAMLLGAGEMAELAAQHLLQAGIDELLILNRTFERGQELAARFRGTALPFENLPGALIDADIVIASTGSPQPLVGPEAIGHVLKRRKNRPLFFIDIAVPRDIDPLVNNFDNVYLYDIDDLKEIVEENLAGRREEAVKAQAIIDEETDRFGRWLANLDVKPTILDLIARGEAAGRQEVAATLKKLGPVSPEIREAVESLALALVRKLNHDPIAYLKREGMGKETPLARADQVRKIFNLDWQYPSRNHP